MVSMVQHVIGQPNPMFLLIVAVVIAIVVAVVMSVGRRKK
jgi:uncharacterized membrane protein